MKLVSALWLVAAASLIISAGSGKSVAQGLGGSGGKELPIEVTADQTLEWLKNEQVYVARGKAAAKYGGGFRPGDAGKPVECINNNAWQHARTRAAKAYQEKFGRAAPWGFEHVRVHDLKHTFGRRLRAAGVGEETRKVLLGHTNGDITTHYSAVEIAELIQAVNRIDRSLATPAITLLKVAA